MAFLLDFRATDHRGDRDADVADRDVLRVLLGWVHAEHLTLMAFSVSVGLLVDDAIVVLESVHRKLEDGMPAARSRVQRHEAKSPSPSWRARGRSSPCSCPSPSWRASSAASFYQFGLAIVFSVLVSLLVSLTLTPALCSKFLSKLHLGPFARRIEAFHHGLGSVLSAACLHWALEHRWMVLGIGFATIVGGVMLARGIPVRLPGQDRPLGVPGDDRSALRHRHRGYESRRGPRQQSAASIDGSTSKPFSRPVGGGAQPRINRINLYVGSDVEARAHVR